MKITKLSLLALSFGLFAASCGESTEEGTDTDTTVIAPMETAPMATPDTIMAAPATTDTMMMNSGSNMSMDTMKKPM